jgi:hypothetical protein
MQPDKAEKPVDFSEPFSAFHFFQPSSLRR